MGMLKTLNPEAQSGGRWIADPKEVKLFASFPTGAKVNVSYELNGHYYIRSIKQLTLAEQKERTRCK